MRTIPVALQDEFTTQQGIRPTFVVGIKWDGIIETKYSTREFVDTYRYVKEFSNFESVSNTEGLGAVSSITVTFFDQFGHFHEKMDTVNILTISVVATVYITDTAGTEYFDLFEGKLVPPIEWNQADKTLKIEIISDENDGTIGYTPSEEDLNLSSPDYPQALEGLNTAMWPEIFGNVLEYESVQLMTRKSATISDEFEYAGHPYTYSITIKDYASMENEYGTPTWFNMVGKDQGVFSLLIYGTLTAGNFTFTDTNIYSSWYKELSATLIDKGEFEAGGNQNAILQIASNGSTTGPDQTTFSGVPWIQFMNIQVEMTYANLVMNGEVIGTTVRTEEYHVTKQGYNLVTGKYDLITLDRPFQYSDAVTVTNIAQVYKSLAPVYKVPADTKIYLLDDIEYYVVDSKSGSTISAVKIRVGDDLEEIPGTLWTGSSTGFDVIVGDTQTHFTIPGEVHMRYLETYEEKDVKEGLLVDVSNSTNTDQEIIAYLSGLTTIDTAPKALKFGYFEEENINDVMPEIAWQSGKAIRRTRSGGSPALELINLITPPAAVFNFTDANVLRNSVVYTYSDESKLYTKIVATIQNYKMTTEPFDVTKKNNISLYDEKELQSDYYTNLDYQTILDFWIDRLSNYRHAVKFTGFLDSFGLEVWDRVNIDFAVPSFYDSSLGTPFNNVHSPTPIKWSGDGFIREIQPEIEQGLIHFTVELDTNAGESPNA